MINDAKAGDDVLNGLEMLNIKDENVSNAAGIALAVFQAAINGDMKAVEKWEKYVDQFDKGNGEDGEGVNIIIDV